MSSPFLFILRLPGGSICHVRAVAHVVESGTGAYGVHRHEVSVHATDGILGPPTTETRGTTSALTAFESIGDLVRLTATAPPAEWRLDVEVVGL